MGTLPDSALIKPDCFDNACLGNKTIKKIKLTILISVNSAHSAKINLEISRDLFNSFFSLKRQKDCRLHVSNVDCGCCCLICEDTVFFIHVKSLVKFMKTLLTSPPTPPTPI